MIVANGHFAWFPDFCGTQSARLGGFGRPMFRSFGNRRIAAIAAVAGAALLAVTVGSTGVASAAFGSPGSGQVQYGQTCVKDGFTYEDSAKVGSSGVIKVWRNAKTGQRCAKLYKTKDFGKPTATSLVLCSTSMKIGGVQANDDVCSYLVGKNGDWDVASADWGNYSQYAGAITIKAPKCLYIAGFTSTAANPSTYFLASKFHGLETYTNKDGSGKFGC